LICIIEANQETDKSYERELNN